MEDSPRLKTEFKQEIETLIGAQAKMKMELKNPTHNWKTQRKPLQIE